MLGTISAAAQGRVGIYVGAKGSNLSSCPTGSTAGVCQQITIRALRSNQGVFFGRAGIW